jgi:hypothetical protein
MKKGLLVLTFFAVVVILGTQTASSVLAQDTPRAQRKIQLSAADDTAAAEATVDYGHALPAKTDAGAALRHSDQSSLASRAAGRSDRSSDDFNHGEGEELDRLRFPGDLSFFGGPTVPFAQSHPIFLASSDGTTCPANTCWGDPNTFLGDFGRSGLSHVTDQYVGQFADNRYTLGDEFILPFTPRATPLIDANIRAIVHAAAVLSGESGFNHEFHVFLPPGQDECFSAAFTTCYSPDNPGSFAFCAYHSSVTFKDVGLVLYSVEPFQNVPGCNVRPGTVNGQLIDSTNSTLSHELIETITDPRGNAWFNFTDNGLAGEEIGDECQLITLIQVAPNHLAVFGDPIEFRVGRHNFATQPEYSNEDHACAIRP